MFFKKVILFFLVIMVFAFSELPAQEISSTNIVTYNTQVRNFLKEFKWSSDTTLNTVRSALFLTPTAYRNYVMEQFRAKFGQKIASSKRKQVTLEIVVGVIEELVPQGSVYGAKKKLRIIEENSPFFKKYPRIKKLEGEK